MIVLRCDQTPLTADDIAVGGQRQWAPVPGIDVIRYF
jgi:hypothetical protein